MRQVTECFIYQPGLFKICDDTRYGMDRFFSFGFEIQLYEKIQNQKILTPIILELSSPAWKCKSKIYTYLSLILT